METIANNGADLDFAHDAEGKMPVRHLEYFWLCEDCAPRMTLVFERGTGVRIRPLARAKGAGLAG
jgi:hypothetical protein